MVDFGAEEDPGQLLHGHDDGGQREEEEHLPLVRAELPNLFQESLHLYLFGFLGFLLLLVSLFVCLFVRSWVFVRSSSLLALLGIFLYRKNSSFKCQFSVSYLCVGYH